MTDGKARAAEPSFFQGLASSPAREATRRATRRFCKLFQPSRERTHVHTYMLSSAINQVAHVVSDGDNEMFLDLGTAEAEPAGTTGSRGRV